MTEELTKTNKSIRNYKVFSGVTALIIALGAIWITGRTYINDKNYKDACQTYLEEMNIQNNLKYHTI